MPERDSVLAHLGPWFYQPIEDRGTDALAYILNNSEECRFALSELLQDKSNPLPPIAEVTTQVVDDLQSRPDMIGCDQAGNRRIIAEVKFWAILQPDQAGRYYEKLAETGTGILLFVCPDARIPALWDEVQEQLAVREPSLRLGSSEDSRGMRKALVKGDPGRSVVMLSWKRLLDHLDYKATKFDVRSNIHQLRGLVRWQNERSFQKLDPDAPASAVERRDAKLQRLIANAKRQGVAEGWLSTKGLSGTGRRRYFSIEGASPDWLKLEIRHGERFSRTPIWVGLRAEDWKGGDLPASCVRSRNYCYFPIDLRFGLDDASLLRHLVARLNEIADLIEEACPV